MSDFHVPLIMRGVVVDDADLTFETRRGGATFTTPNVARHSDSLTLATPAALADLHDLTFDEILDYLAELGQRLIFADNVHMQKAFALSVRTSGLSEPILRYCYETMGAVFDRDYVRRAAEVAIGLPYLEGWVEKDMGGGCVSRIRAFGARAVHILAGTVPTAAAIGIMRNAVIRSDAIFKTPSNDPLTAAAVARTMVEMAPDHPITRHVSVAYWKGGNEAVEAMLYQPTRIEKLIAWGGQASITHIAKYIQPGIDLITLDPKLSASIVGHAAFADEDTMIEVAGRLAMDIGHFNQEGCVAARVVHVQSGTDADGIDRAIRFGEQVFKAIQALSPQISGPARRLTPALSEEIASIRMIDDDHTVFGGGGEGAVIVSRNGMAVDFAHLLAQRVANIVPIDDIATAVQAVNAYTQTVGIYPEGLKDALRDQLVFHGAQRLTTLGCASRLSHAGPHDGIELLRRMCKWIVDERYDL